MQPRHAGDGSGCKPAVFVHRQFRLAADGSGARVGCLRVKRPPNVEVETLNYLDTSTGGVEFTVTPSTIW